MTNYESWNHIPTNDIKHDLEACKKERDELEEQLLPLCKEPDLHRLEIYTKRGVSQRRQIEINFFTALLKWRDDPTHTFKKVCPFCGVESKVTVKCNHYIAWKSGELIQDAFPDTPASDRELLMTGICSSCWEATCG